MSRSPARALAAGGRCGRGPRLHLPLAEQPAIQKARHQSVHRLLQAGRLEKSRLAVDGGAVEADHPGRRAGGAEERGVVRQGARRQLLDRFRRRGLALRLGGEALRRQVLRRGHHRRQRHDDGVDAGVRLALDPRHPRAGIDRERAGAGRLREVEQLGELGADLTGLRVDTVAPAQDQVEGLPSQRQRQGARRGQGVGSGEGAIAQVQGPIGSQGQALGQRLARLRRAHGDGHHLAAVLVPQLHRPQQGADVERAHLGPHPLAPERLGLRIELQLRDDRHLFDADGDEHGGNVLTC